MASVKDELTAWYVLCTACGERITVFQDLEQTDEQFAFGLVLIYGDPPMHVECRRKAA